MTEPDVALTDFVLGIECAAFALLLRREPASPLRSAFVLAFAFTAFGSFAGGAVHGFFLEPSRLAYRFLWPSTLLAIGATAAALASAAVEMSDAASRLRRRARLLLVAGLVVYSALVLLGEGRFVLAVAAYVPASLLLAFAFARWAQARDRRSWLGAAALLLGVLAGVLQQLRFTPLPGRVTHNAFFHLLQMIGLAALFVASRRVSEARIGGAAP